MAGYPYFVADHVPYPAIDLVTDDRVVTLEPQQVAEMCALLADVWDYFTNEDSEVESTFLLTRIASLPTLAAPQPAPVAHGTPDAPAGGIAANTAGGTWTDQPCDVAGCDGADVAPVTLGRWPAYTVRLCGKHRGCMS